MSLVSERYKHKIKSPPELSGMIANLKSKGVKVVQCHGTFDLLHRGHLHQFEQAKEHGNILVVSITVDEFVAKGPERPVFGQTVRAEMVAALEIVDFVTLSNSPSSVELIKLLKPDVYVKGESYQDADRDLSGKIVLEQEAVESVGGKIFFSQEMPIHSTPLLNNFIDPYPEAVLGYLEKMKKRYSFDDVVGLVDCLKQVKVLVIGEAIIDQYDYVEQMDTSPKGGVIAMRHVDSELFSGGSLACANHIANFCSEVTLVSYLGSRDSHEEMIKSSLAQNITPWFLVRDGVRTIVKRRQVTRGYFVKQSETYLFDDQPLNEGEEEELKQYLTQNINNFDLIFVIDYGHGLFTDKIVRFLKDSASSKLCVNAQTNSANKGFNLITKYPEIHYACLDYYELKLAMRDKLSRPDQLALKLLGQSHSSTVAVTLGHMGSIVVDNKGDVYNTPVFTKKVVDTVGAGDAFFSVTAPCVTLKMPPDLVGFIGNVAGSLATTYIGNQISVNKAMLLNFIKSLLG